MFNVLLSDPDSEWTNGAQEYLTLHKITPHIAETGQDCKASLNENKFIAVVLNLKTHDCDAFEVLRFLKANSPSTKVILSFDDQSHLERLNLSKQTLKQLGIDDLLIKPYSMDELGKHIDSINQYEDWNSIKKAIAIGHHDDAIEAHNDEFSPIPIEIFHENHAFIIDVFIKISEHKFLKILHAGDSMEETRVKTYEEVKHVVNLYFKSEERSSYINHANSLLTGLMQVPSQEDANYIQELEPPIKNITTEDDIMGAIDAELIEKEKMPGVERSKEKKTLKFKSKEDKLEQKIILGNSILKNFLTEINIEGLKPEAIEMGTEICENIYNMVKQTPDLDALLHTFRNLGSTEEAHIFLTSFFSASICQNLEWGHDKAIEVVSFAGLLHDIGIIELPEAIQIIPVADLDEYEFKIYKEHPKLGAQLLQNFPLINDQVRLIVQQHHERINGSGYPKGLSGLKVFPMAQVVGIADALTDFMLEYSVGPRDAFTVLIQEDDFKEGFAPEIIKALADCFITKKKKTAKGKKKKRKANKMPSIKVKQTGIF